MQWSLVTGGAKGLGAEICAALAERGHHLLVHYRRNDPSDTLNKCPNAQAVQGDLSTMEGLEEFIQQCAPYEIRYLVNNVGTYATGSPLEGDWPALFHTNLHVPVALSRAFSQSIVKFKGSILNLGVAGLGHVPADVYSTAYTSAKLSLLAFTKALAKQLAPEGVTVNMLSPGYLENSIDLPKTFPMKRPATLREAAEAAVFLLKNPYITGQNVEIAGGVRL